MSKPELRRTSSDVAVTDFPLATTEKWKSKTGEDRSETTWTKIVCWGRLAETTVQYIERGDLVYVEGKISNRKYEKDGQIINVTEVEACQVLRCDSKSKNTQPDSEVSEDSVD